MLIINDILLHLAVVDIAINQLLRVGEVNHTFTILCTLTDTWRFLFMLILVVKWRW